MEGKEACLHDLFHCRHPFFGHANIIKYCKRPFKSHKDMDETIINNINSVVKRGDTLYILGDFAFKFEQKYQKDAFKAYRRAINCGQVILIAGNHDPHYRNGAPKEFLKELFTEVHQTAIYKFADPTARETGGYRQIFMSHYAHRVWPNSFRHSYHLFGHSHGALTDDPMSLAIDIGVDSWDYKPVDLGTVCETMRKRQAYIDRVLKEMGVAKADYESPKTRAKATYTD